MRSEALEASEQSGGQSQRQAAFLERPGGAGTCGRKRALQESCGASAGVTARPRHCYQLRRHVQLKVTRIRLNVHNDHFSFNCQPQPTRVQSTTVKNVNVDD